MPNCKVCTKSIPETLKVDNKTYTISTRRTRCFECSPFSPDRYKKKQRTLSPPVDSNLCQCGNSKKPSVLYCKPCRVNNRRFVVRAKCIAYLGGKCSLCGYNRCYDAFTFHHKNPQEKDFSIGGNHCRKWESIKAELDKCLLLCYNCHQEVHEKIDEQTIAKRQLLSKNQAVLKGENLCRCGRVYTIDRAKGNRGTKCNSCQAKQRRRSLKERLVAIKGGSCAYCGYSKSLRALVFHHNDPSLKDFNVGRFRDRRKISEILEELDKCTLLCHNCHREEHVNLGSNVPAEFISQVIQNYESTRRTERPPRKVKKPPTRTASKPKTNPHHVPKPKREPKVKPPKKIREVKRPPRETLEKLLWELPSTKIAEMYNVSDKAVEKWAKYYSLTKPPRGYWAKLYAAKL